MQLKMLNDPVLIWGTLISVALGLVAFFTAKDVAGNLGVVIGLQGLGITLLIQILGTQAGARDLATTQSRVYGRAEGIPWFPQWLDQASRALEDVTKKYPASPADDEAHRLLDEALATLNGLALGQIVVPYEDVHLILNRTAKTTSSLKATALQSVDERNAGESWWKTGRAQTYWQAQKEAMARQVRIERVFVYKDWSAPLNDIANEQKAGGVVVYRVRVDALPSGIAKDLIVWDENCAFETRFEGDGTTQKNCFTVDPVQVRQLEEVYGKIRDHAERF